MSPSDYLPEHMGHASIDPAGNFIAGSFASLTLTYTAGTFGIDDSGTLKITWRGTSDIGRPQFTDPAGANYTTVEASNGAVLHCRVDRVHVRPWVNTLFIRVDRGFLRQGDTVTVRFGDRRQGSPGLRLQTNAEPTFEFKTFVDAFATYMFTELPHSPEIALVAGAAMRFKAILPTLAVAGEPFRLAVLAEDAWGNPSDHASARLRMVPSVPVQGLPDAVILHGDGPIVFPGLRISQPCDFELHLLDPSGAEVARANPMRVVDKAPLRHYWGDLHSQSEETIGTNTAEESLLFARDRAFVDITGHQGNDFQITDQFWQDLNGLMAKYNDPGRFITVPGYEWSGNTGMGGDRNVFYLHEGRPIHRSSRVLVRDAAAGTDCYTAAALFAALRHEDAVVIAHVGGRYADLAAAHDPRLQRTVEVHSTWGTFEWLLHDAFDLGQRPGVVCHSDDHKGRPGAARPGASTFGAIGGLTCYLMPELTRPALFATLRRRHHYGTTGTRMFLSVTGQFPNPIELFEDDPALGPCARTRSHTAMMGDIVRSGAVPMRLDIDAVGSAPIERIEVFHGKHLVHTERGFTAADLGRRVRLMWQGAEYRGRGREVFWRGSATLAGNSFLRAEPVNFLNPERRLEEKQPGQRLAWDSVTTGNMAGIDFWLNDADAGVLEIETNIVSATLKIARIGLDDIVLPAGGLGRQLRAFRLPETHAPRRLTFTHTTTHAGTADLPVFVRVTQEDGHQCWSSPIYLIG